MSNLIIFDLDGVITSEEAYWDTAGLVLHELLYSPQYWNVAHATSYQPPTTAEESHRVATSVLPTAAIVNVKARAVNSNWDTCYVGVCLCLIHLLAVVPELDALFPLKPERAEWIAAFRAQLARIDTTGVINADLYRHLDDAIFQGYTGLDFLTRFNVYASELLGRPVENVFARYSP